VKLFIVHIAITEWSIGYHKSVERSEGGIKEEKDEIFVIVSTNAIGNEGAMVIEIEDTFVAGEAMAAPRNRRQIAIFTKVRRFLLLLILLLLLLLLLLLGCSGIIG